MDAMAWRRPVPDGGERAVALYAAAERLCGEGDHRHVARAARAAAALFARADGA
jgi:hypothetical protein